MQELMIFHLRRSLLVFFEVSYPWFWQLVFVLPGQNTAQHDHLPRLLPFFPIDAIIILFWRATYDSFVKWKYLSRVIYMHCFLNILKYFFYLIFNPTNI